MTDFNRRIWGKPRQGHIENQINLQNKKQSVQNNFEQKPWFSVFLFDYYNPPLAYCARLAEKPILSFETSVSNFTPNLFMITGYFEGYTRLIIIQYRSKIKMNLQKFKSSIKPNGKRLDKIRPIVYSVSYIRWIHCDHMQGGMPYSGSIRKRIW